MKRVRILAAIGTAIFVLLLIRLGVLQFLRASDFDRLAILRESSVRMLPAPRARIRTAAGEVLAEDRHVIDFKIPAGRLFPERAACILFIDQLNRVHRKAQCLREPPEFDIPADLTAQQLLDLWARGSGNEFLRIAADLTAPNADRLRLLARVLVPPGSRKSIATLPVGAAIPGLPRPRELWINVTALGLRLDASPSRGDICDAVAAGLARQREGRAFLEMLETVLGGHAGDESHAAFRYESRRSYAARKEAFVFPYVLPEDEGRRLARHLQLRRQYFPGLELRSRDEGSFFRARRRYGAVFTSDYQDVHSRLVAMFGREGYGSAALRAEFVRNADRIRARMEELPRDADALFRAKYEERLRTRPPDIAWELAESWRARYLEHALFARELVLLEDARAFGADAIRLLELLPANAPIAVRSRYVRSYPCRKPGSSAGTSAEREAVGSLVGLARPLQQTIGADSPDAFADFQRELALQREFLEGLRGAADIQTRFMDRRRSAPPLRTAEDVVGIQGLERAVAPPLNGLVGLDAVTPEEHVEVPPIAGNDVEIVTDLAFTRAMYAVLEKASLGAFQGARCRSGVVAVMDLREGREGDLICLASYPGFDPQKYVAGDAPYIARLEARAKDAPLLNHCFFPLTPGSAFKLVVAAAYLQQGGSPALSSYCPGSGQQGFHCPQPHGSFSLNMHEALKRSCNHYFVVLGTEHLGLRNFVKWLELFGFGPRPDALPAETVRNEPPDYGRTLKTLEYYMCYGSGEIQVLPLAMLRFVAAIGRGGTAPRPRLLRDAPPRIDALPLSKATCATLARAMTAVVDEAHGTANDPECGLHGIFSVAVKTGTAEIDVKTKSNNAWVVAFAPASAPKFAFVVCLERTEHGGHGGKAAGPVLAEALKYLADNNYAPGLRIGGAR